MLYYCLWKHEVCSGVFYYLAHTHVYCHPQNRGRPRYAILEATVICVYKSTTTDVSTLHFKRNAGATTARSGVRPQLQCIYINPSSTCTDELESVTCHNRGWTGKGKARVLLLALCGLSPYLPEAIWQCSTKVHAFWHVQYMKVTCEHVEGESQSYAHLHHQCVEYFLARVHVV